MTVVEKAAYLKGLAEGLGVDPSTREGKLWGALCDLVADMAHEIEDLQDTSMDVADAIDEIGDELSYLEELTCDLDMPEDMTDEDVCDGDCASCSGCGSDFDADDDDDEELDYDGIIYDVICPKCGEEITFDEDTLDAGSIECPKCGENLEFDLDSIEDDNSGSDELPF